MENSQHVQVITHNTIVVGSGAAGFNAADRLCQYGQTDVGIVTEGVNNGTSRNTGSDKQTYYKITLSGEEPDSVRKMAQTLFSGQCVDGDTALCEAALSAECFLHLTELGVPFPRNRYGEYVGYKTDHDPLRRATSAGPYTSRLMTEALEKSVLGKGIPVYDRLQVIRVLSDGRKAAGLLCISLDKQDDPEKRFVAVCCKNIIFATGGPAGIYAESVYPSGHFGATGLALRAGARGCNLTEWQYGLASLHPRWNVSGSYMQVLPRFVSAAQDGSDEKEFLCGFFQSQEEMLSKIFLKGYQWPFDVRRVAEGSSMIDILVYLESRKGRRVFLDFRSNPGGKEIDYSSLCPEAREYLEQAGACFGNPVDRLCRMNEPAAVFYREHGVDLSEEMLEIALCAQHNNGGLAVDCWWRTSLEGLFAAGEAAGTHGVYRPGGSALNAGQAGSARAAMYIAAMCRQEPEEALFRKLLQEAVEEAEEVCESALGQADTLRQIRQEATMKMSRNGGAVRSRAGIKKTLDDVVSDQMNFADDVRVNTPFMLNQVFRLKDILFCQQIYLSAMLDYIERGGKSRGSAFYTDPKGECPLPSLPEDIMDTADDGSLGDMVQEVQYGNGETHIYWRQVRPVPEEDGFFENVWRDYRERCSALPELFKE